MKLGKRRWESKLEKSSREAETSHTNPALESWTVRAEPEPEPDAATTASAPPPPAEEPATVVDGDAVELPLTEVAAAYEPEPAVPERVLSEPLPPPGASWAPAQPPPPPPEPTPMPYPVAEEPVLVYTSAVDPPAVTPLAAAGEAHASGHASGTSPSWPEPVLELAAERPEVVVGAAFAGGLLLAMILRRLGH